MKRRSAMGLVAAVSALAVFGAGCAGNRQAASDQAAGAAYPEKDITMIVQAAAGGASDLTARSLAKEMERTLGRSIIVQNRPGAAGSIALSYLAGEKPDGYTIGYMPVEISMLKQRGYDVTPDKFTLLGQVVSVPATVVVKADSPHRTLGDLVAAARSQPGAVTVANSGAGSIWEVSTQALAKAAGVEFKPVPFDGGAPAVAAVLGGQVDAAVVGTSEAVPGVRDGRLRALAVLDGQRNDQLVDVPTAVESGFEVNIGAWGGIGAPAGLPPEIREKLAKVIDEAARSESYRHTITTAGAIPVVAGPDEFTAFAAQEFTRFQQLMSGS
jgi:tripartite-type tricarboxylate transporter receptor subunit TctC